MVWDATFGTESTMLITTGLFGGTVPRSAVIELPLFVQATPIDVEHERTVMPAGEVNVVWTLSAFAGLTPVFVIVSVKRIVPLEVTGLGVAVRPSTSRTS